MSVDEAVSELIDQSLTDFKVDIHADLEGTVGELVTSAIRDLDWSDKASEILGSVDVEDYIDIPRILRDNDVVTDSDVADKVSEGIDGIDWDDVIRSNELMSEGEVDDKIQEVADNIDWDSIISDNELVRVSDLDDAVTTAVETAVEEAISGNIDLEAFIAKNDLVSKRALQAALAEASIKADAPVANIEPAVLNAVEIRITALETKVDMLTGLLIKAHTALQMQAEVAEAVTKLAAAQPAA